ncbi:hypothetical protein [Clostridium chauvoei]|uniref:Uncharacterized protein n=2 Tax=Clostridium chauvoei TaxID=46867 RepID=S6EWJ6_9CLOT|nr:hypothetical protein [Clostridium chauvoei]ATD56022.1 hypothetical protein BTM20_12730 [Clostridium chauvoei]ATD56309.1 hypothetical protein BTM21_00285 [Clostridium chauvoei]MBX7280921.1 hypothetical protein [Clostridium chauvoei]MBX7283404.1 hypothetical protein [Clostridium chauvoei]MBX7285913.1 hypothetical protein [Clostridium chauvoei]
MKKYIIITLALISTLLLGIIIGRFTSPVKEKLIEKEVQKIVEVESPTVGLSKKYLFKFIDIQNEINKLPHNDEKYQTTFGMRELTGK